MNKSWMLAAALLCSLAAQAQPAKKPVAPPKPVPPLAEHLVPLAKTVAVGRVSCELGAFVHISRDDQNPGYFWLELGKQKFLMAPVQTSTGALRLEEAHDGGAVWLQLGNKSMLMHTKQGKRLADACVNAQQALVAEAMERNPQAGLLDDPKPVVVAKPITPSPEAPVTTAIITAPAAAASTPDGVLVITPTTPPVVK